MKDLIKRHKGLVIVGSLSLILVIIIFIIFAKMLFSNSKSEYGDRLNNIVKIDKKVTNEIVESLEEMEEVKKVNIRTQGKIIYTTITFSVDTSKDKAKNIASKTLESYSDDVIECYDFQFLLTQDVSLEEDEDTSYTLAGTKHPEIDHISWTKN